MPSPILIIWIQELLLYFGLFIKGTSSSGEKFPQRGTGNILLFSSVLFNVIGVLYPGYTLYRTMIKIPLLESDVPHHAEKNAG